MSKNSNSDSLRRSVTLWDAPIEVIKSIQQEEPQIYFLDGNSLTGKEAWNKCLRIVFKRLQDQADKEPKNTIVIKKLPWTCGECGKDQVQNLRAYENGPSVIATCDHCGTEWVS